MKAYFLAVLAALSLFTAEAQANNDRTMGISASPISMFLSRFSLLYQYKVFDFLALTVPAKLNYAWYTNSLAKNLKDSKAGEITKTPLDFAVGLGGRLMLNNKGLNDSFYIEPRVWLGYEQFGLKVENEAFEVTTFKIEPILNFGWDWYWEHGFYMGLGFGIGYAYHFKQETNAPKAAEKLKESSFLGMFLPFTPGTITGDSELKIGYSW